MADVNVNDEELKTLIGFHAMTGCDYISSFFRKEKPTCWKKMIEKTRFSRGMTQLGDNVDISEEVYDDLEAYICALYGSEGVTNINQLWYSKFKETNDKEKKYVNLTTVPPCRSSLYFHIKRANRAAYMMKRATLSNVSEPALEDCGWNNDGSINWVAASFPENIQKLIVKDFNVEDNENQEYIGEECDSEDGDDEI